MYHSTILEQKLNEILKCKNQNTFETSFTSVLDLICPCTGLPCMADQDIEIWCQSFLNILTSAGLNVTILLIVYLLFKFCVIIRYVCV